MRYLLRTAFKKESKQNPNYGKATGLGAEKWWSNVSLRADLEAMAGLDHYVRSIDYHHNE